MNAEQLLQHLERISEVPDAIARLRRFILDLAVRGKLVEQDPEDEPAAELLKRIAAEKARLLKAGEIKRSKAAEPSMAEANFVLPPTWVWVALGTIFDYDAGSKTDPQKLEQPLWLLELEDIEKDTGHLVARVRASERASQSTKSEFRVDDILYGKLRPYLNKVLVADERGYSTTEIVAIRPYIPICSTYCVLALRRPDFVEYVTRLGQGTKMPRLRTEDAIVAPFPLPPLAEQHRIVARVDELMSLCDQLEAAKAEREQCRDSLVAACLQGLNQPAEEEEAFREHARFTFNNLPRITTRAAHIKQLRQTILNLAVRGKLVEQDPSNEPARQWMSSYRAVQIGKRPRSGLTSTDTPLDNLQAGYKLPATWLWVELGELVVTMDSGWSPQCEQHARNDQSRWGVLKTTSVQPLAYDCRQNKELPVKLEARPQHEAIVGDILITRAGPKNRVGVSCVVHRTEPRLMISDKLIRFRLTEGLSPFFYALAMNAGITSQAIEAAKSGMAVMQMNITQSKLREVPVPLPPLAEQHRIVAKVDELMVICDQLEVQIAVTEHDSRRFLESVLAEALAPAGDLSAEAQVA